MIHCHELEKNQILWCEECGLELKVVAECDDCDPEDKSCGCDCTFRCCDAPMEIKSQ